MTASASSCQKGENMDVTQKFLSECLGITPRQIRNLKQEGLFSLPEGVKRYNLAKCIQEYIRYKVADETGRRRRIDKETISAEHEEVKKQISQLKLRKLRRELHEAVDVELYLTDMLMNFRKRLEGLPQKAAMQITGAKDVTEVMAVLKKNVEDALNELAKYDPDKIDGQSIGTFDEDMELLEEDEDEEEFE